MRIAVLHNALTGDAAPDESDVMVQVEAVTEALAQAGRAVTVMSCDLDLKGLKKKLLSLAPDLVFNLTESLDGQGRFIAFVPSLLAALGIPHTGSAAEALHLTSNKVSAKEKMAAAGLPTPDWTGVYPDEITAPDDILILSPGEDTWIVKSVWEHASLGIDESSLIEKATPRSIFSRLREHAPRLGGHCFAERYINGREFNLSVLAGDNEPVVLPPAEIVFDGYGPDKPKIVGYDAKWNKSAYAYEHTLRSFAFTPEDRELTASLANMARRCFGLFRLKGYARVDFRVDRSGRPWILEVNANPCLSPEAGFQAALDRAGIAFPAAVSRIMDDALRPASPGPGRASLSPRPPAAGSPSVPAGIPDNFQVREAPLPGDRNSIRKIVEETGFFHDYETAVAVELVETFLEQGPACGYAFVFLEYQGSVVGYACYGPIPCTKDSYELYWIAVHPAFQKQGLGRIIIRETEERIRRAGGKRIYLDTSTSDKYRSTFSFYRSCGYTPTALMEDFYQTGDGKAVFIKRL